MTYSLFGRLTADTTAVGIGFALFVLLGVAGYLFFGDQVVVLPVAFAAGLVAGVAGGSAKRATTNGLVASILGFVVLTAGFAVNRVLELHGDDSMAAGDVLFFAGSFFVTEALLGGFVVFLLGYAGAYAAERVLSRREDDQRQSRDFSDLGE